MVTTKAGSDMPNRMASAEVLNCPEFIPELRREPAAELATRILSSPDNSCTSENIQDEEKELLQGK